jgi:hypothetical protein
MAFREYDELRAASDEVNNNVHLTFRAVPNFHRSYSFPYELNVWLFAARERAAGEQRPCAARGR